MPMTAAERKRLEDLERWRTQQIAFNADVRARLAALEGTPEPVPEPEPAPSNPSGQAMPTAEPTGWTRIFADDFTTPTPEGEFLNRPGWTAYPYPWTDTSRNLGRPVEQQGYYDPSIISCHDSVMDIHLRMKDGRWRVAGPEPKVVARGTTPTSARIAVRFKADPVPGFKTAWLLWPTSNVWPRDGEIDFPEGDLTGTISAFMHRQNATSGGDQDVRNTAATYASWHTAVVEWVMGESCAFYLDGVQLGATITNRVPSTPMRYVMQTETRLSSTPPPSGSQGHVLVDWITVAVQS